MPPGADSAGHSYADPEGPDGLSPLGRHAIAGVLRHAPALSALLNPTISSYKRFGPDPCLAMAAVGAAVCLGIEDKAEPPPKLEGYGYGYGYDAGRSPLLSPRLGEALDALEADTELAGVLGEYFVTSFLQAQRDRAAVRAVRHRLGVPRVRLPPVSNDPPVSTARLRAAVMRGRAVRPAGWRARSSPVARAPDGGPGRGSRAAR